MPKQAKESMLYASRLPVLIFDDAITHLKTYFKSSQLVEDELSLVDCVSHRHDFLHCFRR